jgi:cytochrome bd-type quinol oxidase subunit 2
VRKETSNVSDAPVTRLKDSRDSLEPVASLDQVRVELATIWLGGTGIIVLIMVVQSMLGKFEEQVQEAWGWLLPTVMPTLGMIVTVLGYTALETQRGKSDVRRSFYRIARALSIVYIALVLLTILIQPFSKYDSLQLMRMSNLWLGPIQGLVASALGVLFVSRRTKKE